MLEPLGPAGDRRYRTSVIDLQTDTATDEPAQTAPADADQLGGRDAAERLFAQRYHAAAQLYVDAVAPAQRATVIFGNDARDRADLQFMTAA